MLNNRLYNINRWLDNNEGASIALVLFAVFLVFLMPINRIFMGIGISAITLILLKIKIGVFISFDKSKYNIPEIGDKIILIKDVHTLSYIGEYLTKGAEYTIYDVVEQHDDWLIFVRRDDSTSYWNKHNGYRISYIKHKKYFVTKSDIRNKKLEKLLK